jgi:LDH2 family malate/lactate/ureidoglycolate dehydrogenase
VAAAVIHRYGFDDLRRFASAIGAAAGLPPPRSVALASHLLWFDAAGAPNLGIASFPSWLEAIERRRVNPTATGRVISERTALALFDGENGPAPLVLGRAAELAIEKAREAAVGLVRISGVGPIPSAAPVAAGIAIGPMAGWVVGPNHCWSLALPSQGGLPLVVDSGLAGIEPRERTDSAGGAGRRASQRPKTTSSGRDGPASASTLLEGFWLSTEILIPDGGWHVAAISVSAMESLTSWHDRLAAVAARMHPAPGRLLPEAWESRRRQVHQDGVVVDAVAWKSLVQWAHRFSVEVPSLMRDEG